MDVSRRGFLGTVVAGTVMTAGCTGASSPGGDRMTTETETGTDGVSTVQVRSHADLGEILVGPEGMTLYMFDQDTKSSESSTCADDCAATWPPLTVEGKASMGEAVTAELSTFEREDGSTQVAANGWPLYYFAPDDEPGDASGQGVNDIWWVLRRDGSPVRADGETETDGRY